MKGILWNMLIVVEVMVILAALAFFSAVGMCMFWVSSI